MDPTRTYDKIDHPEMYQAPGLSEVSVFADSINLTFVDETKAVKAFQEILKNNVNNNEYGDFYLKDKQLPKGRTFKILKSSTKPMNANHADSILTDVCDLLQKHTAGNTQVIKLVDNRK